MLGGSRTGFERADLFVAAGSVWKTCSRYDTCAGPGCGRGLFVPTAKERRLGGVGAGVAFTAGKGVTIKVRIVSEETL
jgi:hypothetical protein